MMLPRTKLQVEIINTNNCSGSSSELDVIVTGGKYLIEFNEYLIRVNKDELVKLIDFKGKVNE